MISTESIGTPVTHSEFWGNTTDPHNHTPDTFRYLVHIENGLRKSGIKGSELIAWNPALEGAHFIDNPDDIRKTKRLPTSLIDQDHRSTFLGSRLGLILNVPTPNILVTSTHDVYSSLDKHFSYALQYGEYMDPDTLLERSTDGYNEVVCTGENITIAGLLFLTGPWKYRNTRPSFEHVVTRAHELELPLVTLEPHPGAVR